MARFDWYQATVRAPVDCVLEALAGLGEASMRHGRGMHGYGHETALVGADGPLAKVWHGGSHTYPHVVLSGEISQPGAELIRARFPEVHLVTRADACEDFDAPGVFDAIQDAMLEVAKKHRVKVDNRGDHLLTKEGRTTRLGSSSSACITRLYDKSAELRSKFAADPVRLATVPDNLVRLEAQVRPQTAKAREAFATIEPLAVMGSATWQRHLWQLVMGQSLQPVEVGKPWRQSDDDRAYAYLLAQYGKVLQRMHDDLGSWDCVGKQIGSDLAARSQAKREGHIA